MTLKNIPHQFYYLLELGVLLSGFFLIFLLSFSFLFQLAALLLVLVFYSILGIFHHKLHHTLKAKIVIEYVLVSAVLLAVFLLLNIGKI